MADYRLYLLNDNDHIVNAEVVSCETDRDALASGAAIADGRSFEVWELGRFVGKITAPHLATTTTQKKQALAIAPTSPRETSHQER